MTAKRVYVVRESFAGGSLTIKDGISPFLKVMAATHSGAAQRALRHVGFHVQKELKEGVRSGHVGGMLIQPQSVLTSTGRKALDSNRIKSTYSVKGKNGQSRERTKFSYKNNTGADIGRHLRRKQRFMGRINSRNQNLSRAIGYQEKPQVVLIGWLSRSSAKWGKLVQEGQTITVTPRMRRYYFSIGLSLAATTKQIVMEPNPIIEPYFHHHHSRMIKRFQVRFIRNLLRQSQRSRRIA